MQKIKAFLKVPIVSRTVHTFWQAAAGVLIMHLCAGHNSADVKLAVIASSAAGLAAVKTLLLAAVEAGKA